MNTHEIPPPARVLRLPGGLPGAALTGAAGLALAGVLAACGGASTVSTASGPAAGPQTVAATGQAANPGQQGDGDGGAGDGFRGEDFAKVRACLTAAGITVPTPTARPGGGSFTRTPGAGTGRPRFSITRGPDGKYTAPDGQVFTAPPTRGPGNRGPGGTFGGLFADPKVQAALKACGLTVPTGPPGGTRPNVTPTT